MSWADIVALDSSRDGLNLMMNQTLKVDGLPNIEETGENVFMKRLKEQGVPLPPVQGWRKALLGDQQENNSLQEEKSEEFITVSNGMSSRKRLACHISKTPSKPRGSSTASKPKKLVLTCESWADEVDDDGEDLLSMEGGAPIEELTEERVQKRQRAIDLGKATPGYQNYVAKVKPSERKSDYKLYPATPNKRDNISHRAWVSKIRFWRVALHKWDDDPSVVSNDKKSTDSPAKQATKSKRVKQHLIFDDAQFPALNN